MLLGQNRWIAVPGQKLSAAIYLRSGTALAPRLQPVIEALRSAGLSEPMVTALLDRANGSTGKRSASVAGDQDHPVAEPPDK